MDIYTSILAVVASSVVFLGSSADMKSLESKFGVSIDRNWYGYSISAHVHGEYQEIATAPLSSTPEQLAKKLQLLREDKILALEKIYGVKIGRSGSAVSQSAYGQMHQTEHCVPVRAPKLSELEVLDYALAHSEPSQLIGANARSKGVNIYFLEQIKPFSASEWGLDGTGKPSIFVEPRKGVTFGHTLEENLMHQFSHNSAYRMGWNPKESWRWPMAAKLGFKFVGDPNIVDMTLNGHMTRIKHPDTSAAWLIKSSEGPNYFYRQIDPESWIRCNSSMQPLDEAGKVVAKDRAKTLSSEKLREFALVKPASFDFSTPPEVFADALAMFRADRDSRAELLNISPVLYNLVRVHDQAELDKTYGKGVKVRSVNGTISEPSQPIMLEIKELEEGIPS